MLKKIISIVCLSLIGVLSANEPLTNNHYKLGNDLSISQNSDESSEESTGTTSVRRKKSAVMGKYRDDKSPLLASGLSLLLPGAGEIYGEDYIMGSIFLGVEAALWGTYLYYDKEGDDKTRKFHDFADASFSHNRYYNGMYQMMKKAGVDSIALPTITDLEAMSSDPNDPVWQNATHYLNKFQNPNPTDANQSIFTHQLPTSLNANGCYEVDKTQQYYEMIGKYTQFESGWDDYTGWDFANDTLKVGKGTDYKNYSSNKRLNIYEDMRREANEAYDAGTNMVMLTIVNRLVSMFDAAYIIKRDFALNTAIRVQNNPYHQSALSLDNYKVSLNISW